mgnify:FL=1
MIKKYGATLHEVTKEQGGFAGAIKMADALALEINGFRPQQFFNAYNEDAHYKTTGLEIEVASTLISAALKGRIREEAQDANMLRKTSKLPL